MRSQTLRVVHLLAVLSAVVLPGCGPKTDSSSKRTELGETFFFAEAKVPGHKMQVRFEAGRNISFKQRSKNDVATYQLQLPAGNFDSAEGLIVKNGKLHGNRFRIKEGPGKFFSIKIPTGNDYRVRALLYKNGRLVGRGYSPRLVVGDIFLVAGQSNSTNAGSGKTKSKSDGAFMFTGKTWQHAADPLPTADGTLGSSPWPHFGDFYYKKTGVPVAVVSLGWSATTVSQWQPKNASNLNNRLQVYAKSFGSHGFRAVLWHQGESDVFAGTRDWQYRKRMQNLIKSVRNAVDWDDMPWFVAQTSYIGVQGYNDLCNSLGGYASCANEILSRQQHVLNGQATTIQYTHNVFYGANTDELWGAQFRAYQNNSYIHFNPTGQYHHAWRWSEAVTKQIPKLK